MGCVGSVKKAHICISYLLITQAEQAIIQLRTATFFIGTLKLKDEVTHEACIFSSKFIHALKILFYSCPSLPVGSIFSNEPLMWQKLSEVWCDLGLDKRPWRLWFTQWIQRAVNAAANS